MSLAATAPGLLSESAGYRRAAGHFGEAATVGAYLEFEAALARVQAGLGVIPAGAGRAIARVCRCDLIDMDALRRGSAAVGYPIVTLVSLLADRAGDHGRWVHYGATTQDAMDTGQVLQLRRAVSGILEDLAGVEACLADLCRAHRRTPMVGRSKLQHAIPISFGYKVAVWLDQLARTSRDLARAMAEASVLQFGGAAGTLAALRSRGMAVRRGLARDLGLDEADISWHVSRDRMARLGFAIAATLAALGKIAGDIAFLASTEVGELREPPGAGRGGSSTMPQKRNPVLCEAIIEAARCARPVPGEILDAMAQEQERGIGHGYRERALLCGATLELAGAASVAGELLRGLEVDTGRMCENLERAGGLAHAESVMIHLGETMGRIEAHHLLRDVTFRIGEHDGDFRRALRAAVGPALPEDAFSAAAQIEPAQEMIDRVLSTVARPG